MTNDLSAVLLTVHEARLPERSERHLVTANALELCHGVLEHAMLALLRGAAVQLQDAICRAKRMAVDKKSSEVGTSLFLICKQFRLGYSYTWEYWIRIPRSPE